ncbi:MAG TPA: hypothetical protein H9722_05870 [Candidatus Mediterraneibacter pullistercoris]|nr:hypothetical protein [Candidatus Mediterraneibacter pullistercoris]
MLVCMSGCAVRIKPGGTAGARRNSSSCPCNVSVVWDESFFVVDWKFDWESFESREE